jgi:hypothetical protein
MALPERYDGKVVVIVGYLAAHNGEPPMLFPSKESHDSHSYADSVYVGGDIPPAVAANLKQGVWVVVAGKFDAKFMGQMGSLGAVWRPYTVMLTGEKSDRYLLPKLSLKKPIVLQAHLPNFVVAKPEHQ